ncbi:MAG: polysaccharide deacetylase family protein [Candidatus Poribacteria bacterium]
MITISLSIMLSLLSALSSEGNLTEKLGYPSDTKLLIIHGDDVGMCHAANEATIKALEKGIVTSGSIMVPCPWFLEIAEYCRAHPEADLGVHLTLTSEWKHYRWRPVSSIDRVPGLVDDEGYLWHSVEDVVQHATPEEVEMEIRAQVQRAIDFGVKPTHIDTHMGTVYASPEFFQAYCKVAREFNLPPMIISPKSEIAQKRLKNDPTMASYFEMFSTLSNAFPSLDELATGVSSAELERRREEYREVIRNLKPGVTQIIVHLGLDHPEIQAITSSWLARYNDFRIFTEPEMKKFIAGQGVKLIGWRDLKK